MLSRLIGSLYAWIIEVYLWLALLISSVAGYQYAIPMLKSAGLTLQYPIVGKVLGAILLALATFLASALAIGPVVVLLDIRRAVRSFATTSSGNGNAGIASERREPFL